jgi:hypothetical protein
MIGPPPDLLRRQKIETVVARRIAAPEADDRHLPDLQIRGAPA